MTQKPYVFDPIEKVHDLKSDPDHLYPPTLRRKMKGSPGNYKRGEVYWFPEGYEEAQAPWFRKPHIHEQRKVDASRP